MLSICSLPVHRLNRPFFTLSLFLYTLLYIFCRVFVAFTASLFFFFLCVLSFLSLFNSLADFLRTLEKTRNLWKYQVDEALLFPDEFCGLTTMDYDDDDDLWGPPLVVVQEDTFRKQILRGCEFWFDCRTDVLEEKFQTEKYCEQVWRILTEERKKQDVVIAELETVSVQNDMVSCGSGGGGGDSNDIGGSSDSDKTLSAILPDADTSSAKFVLDEDENTSSISDAQTIETRDSCNDTDEIQPETRLKLPLDTAANDPIPLEVAEDADNSSSPVVASKIDEAEEHSCSSLVSSDQVFDPIKQAPENKSSSPISRENIGGGSTLGPLLSESGEKLIEKVNVTHEDGEILKDHQHSDSLQDIVSASEPFTTESLLEMCDEPEKGREISCDEIRKKLHPDAVKTLVKDELIINLLSEARKKTESNALLNPGSVLTKKRKKQSNGSDIKGVNSNFIRNIKQKVKGGVGEIIKCSSVPTQHADSLLESIDGISQRGGSFASDSVKSLSTSDLKNKSGKELRSIAKELKVTHYYKLKKEDLVQLLIGHINSIQPIVESRELSHN